MSLGKKKRLLLIILIFMCCFLSLAYVTIMNRAIVEAKLRVKSAVWKVRFSDIKTISKTGSADNYEYPLLTDNYISIHAMFEKPSDSISYKVKVSNNGNLKAKVANIGVYSNLKDLIDFSYDDIEVGRALNPGESLYFNIKFTYNPKKEVTSQVDDKILLVLDWKQAD